MTNCSSSFQRNVMSILIYFTLLRFCSPRNSFDDLDLSTQTLNPVVTGFKITGNAAGDYLGQSVSTAGDINGDGYDDIIVGAYQKNTGQGLTYVIYGGEEAYFLNIDFSTTSLNPLSTGFMITGYATGDLLGYSVSTAGDINNDGYDDIIVGAPWKNSYQGAAYVIYGGDKSSMSNWDFSSGATLNPTSTGFMITGNAGWDYLGFSVSTAGDINNDGYDDLIVGAHGKNAIYVIYGGAKSTRFNIVLSSTTLIPTSTGFMITGNAASDNFGLSVSTAGDINKDGYDDIIVGASGKNSAQGAAYVIYGGDKSIMSNIALTSTTLNPLTTGFMITGNAANDQFGISVNTAGDINGDGYDDIIVGAVGKSAAYVIYGGEKSSMSNIILSSAVLNPISTGFMITGSAASDTLGVSVGPTGDLNHDGYDDIIVGANGKNSGQGAGYVIYGGGKSTRSNIDLSSQTLNPLVTGFIITGNAASDWFGISVSKAGDFNNDGENDIIIAANRKNSDQGAAYLIFASCSMNCKQCSSESVCTECKNPYLMYQSKCFASCPAATLQTSPTICSDCPSHCNKCSSTSVCTECKNSYILYQSQCLDSCPDGMFLSTTTCEFCPANCKHCSSAFACTECQSSYFMYQSECFASCPDTTLATSPTTCEDCPAHCNHCSSTSVCTECQNSYLMYQSECFHICPETTFASTSTMCEDCPAYCKHCSSAFLCTECISSFVLYKSQCLTSCPDAMVNSTNICKNCPSDCSSCISQDSCQVCHQGYILSNSLCVLSRAQEKASQVISSVTQGIGSLVCVGSAVFPLSALVSKIVQNTRYLNLSVTSELTEVYKTWNTDLISWNVPNVFSNEDKFKSLPSLFGRYNLRSPFLVNFWPTLLNIGIGFSTFIAFILLKKIFKYEKYEGWAYSLVLKLVEGSFNFALVQAYACLDDILFYLVLDARTNPFNSFFSWSSMISAAIFLVLGSLLVFFNFWTVNKYQSIKNQGIQEIEAFNERNKYWELFYSDFNDDDLWSQSFFAIAIIRSALSSFIIIILYDYPLMQTPYLVIIDVAIISFLYVKNPFNTLRGKLSQYYYEIITLLVHLCTFILSLQDSFENQSETVKIIMSTAILYLNTALVSGAIGFMFIEIYETIRLKSKASEHKPLQGVPEDTQETQNLTQTASLYLPSESEAQKTQEETKSIEKFFFLPENSRKHNNSNFITMESNLNTESSRELDMYPSHLPNKRRILSTRPMSLRHRQHKMGTIFPSYATNQRQFLNS